MKVKKIAMFTVCMALLLAGCNNASQEIDDVIPENAITEEAKAPEIEEEPTLPIHEEEIEEEMEEESWLPDVTKDYKENKYMKYPISSVYFLEKDGYGYELVIAVKNEKEPDRKDVKIFVSKLEGEEYQLQQVLQNEADWSDNYGLNMPEEGLYLMDVNFDGMDDILVHTGFWGVRDHVYYSCFLYNGEEYELCERFFDIPNPSVDTERKQILGYLSGNGWQTHEIYVFENGELYKEKELYEERVYHEGEEGEEPFITYEYHEKVFELKTDSSGTTDWKLVSEEKFSEEENGGEYVDKKLRGEDSYWQFDLRGDKWGRDKLVEE